jgi:RNA polymerase sigma-70 factor (ECF subfamily)
MAQRSDGELVRLAKASDVEAFGELVRRHMKGVYCLAYSFVQNHADADDLSQETFLKAYRSLDSFRERSSFRTWLYRIGFNLCASFVRRRMPSTSAAREGGLAAESLSTAQARFPTPAEAASLRELQTRSLALVRSLPLKLRVALHLVVYDGLSHRDAADVIGCSANTVSWRLFRAREILRQKLEPYIKE